MKILIISPGKAHSQEMRAAITEYESRLIGSIDVTWEFPSPGDRSAEAKSILKLLKPDDTVVLLDERGESASSPDIAQLLESTLNAGAKRLVFIIGGAFGVAPEVAQRANRTLSLSKLVFPHMLVRLILVEQLYRGWSIRTGGKYHHA